MIRGLSHAIPKTLVSRNVNLRHLTSIKNVPADLLAGVPRLQFLHFHTTHDLAWIRGTGRRTLGR